MASYARHRARPARSPQPLLPRVLLRAGLGVTAGAACVAAGTTAANAAALPDAAPPDLRPANTADAGTVLAAAVPTGPVTRALGTSLDGGIGPVKNLRLDPLARTGADPLDNGVGTQIADFKPIGTDLVTKPVTDGGNLKGLPVAGPVVGLLPG
ncbi:hypothetical protein AB0I49_34830 [Streptomyces sp. NPDC050617]|uniref:hypothetical protein n=1 Tax=Streptomyces sp. NPDC050617 TaxID=3154628 RepID=UPI0034221F76